MFRFVPHENNPHGWRTALFVFFVMIISAGGAYFVNANQNIFQKKVAAEKIENVQPKQESLDNPVVVVDDPAPATSEINIPIQATALPVERNKDPQTKLDEAKAYATPQILVGKYIDISLKYQNMVIFEDGKALDAYLISSGKKGMGTPVGTFKIENKSPRAWSKTYSLWMPNWMAFLPSGQMGIHELPIWPGGYQEGANHLGIPVSHGCVRLGVGPAKRVFDWADIGTPVIIHI